MIPRSDRIYLYRILILPALLAWAAAAQGKVVMIQAFEENVVRCWSGDYQPLRLAFDRGSDAGKVIAALKTEDLVDVTIRSVGGQDTIQTAKAYDGDRGEIHPGVYTFGGPAPDTSAPATYTAILLKRLGQNLVVLVPGRKEEGKTPPALLARVLDLTVGVAVCAQLKSGGAAGSPPVLASIERYVKPIYGKYIGTGQVEAALLGNSLPGVNIDVDGKPHGVALATEDVNGKPLTVNQRRLPEKYLPGQYLEFDLRSVNGTDMVKGARFAGDIQRESDAVVLSTWRGMLRFGRDPRQGGGFQGRFYYRIYDNDNDRFIHSLLRLMEARRPPAGLSVGQLSQLKTAAMSHWESFTTPHESDQMMTLYNSFMAAATPEARDDILQQALWGLSVICQRVVTQTDALAKEARGMITDEQYRALIQSTISEFPHDPPSTQP